MAEILVMLLAIAINADPPFTAIMILYANIIADIPPSMSIGIEPAEADVMDRSPRDPKRGVITGITALAIIYQATVMGLIALGLYLWQLTIGVSLSTLLISILLIASF
jgi:Ca2+-transporting ATPase